MTTKEERDEQCLKKVRRVVPKNRKAIVYIPIEVTAIPSFRGGFGKVILTGQRIDRPLLKPQRLEESDTHLE